MMSNDSDELKFDAEDTNSLFEAYSQKHNREFKPIQHLPIPDLTDFKVDKYKNKIYEAPHILTVPFDKLNELLTQDQLKQVLKKVAQKVKENSDLFAQIEFQTRGFAADKVRSYDIELLVKEFQHYSERSCLEFDTDLHDKEFPLNLTTETPLCSLGVLARYMRRGQTIRVFSSSVDSSVVGSLFVELCLQAGYPAGLIQWGFCALPTLPRSFPDTYGTIGVVTETADIDSAVDCLVDATQDCRYPWHLRRIFVQECVYGRFKRALARSGETQPPDGLCSAHYSRGSQHFLVDFTGSSADVTPRQSIVLVEAYRTTKELLSLLRKHRPLYLSLWCSDLSISYEIALSNDYSVWINDFACLRGDHKKSHSSVMVDDVISSSRQSRMMAVFIEEYEPLKGLRNKWLEKKFELRREVVLGVLRSAGLDDVVEGLVGWAPETFASVVDGTLCQGFQGPRGVLPCCFNIDHCSKCLLQTLRSFIIGNALMIPEGQMEVLTKDLVKVGVPIVTVESSRLWLFSGVGMLFRTRVISSHFGETFAN